MDDTQQNQNQYKRLFPCRGSRDTHARVRIQPEVDEGICARTEGTHASLDEPPTYWEQQSERVLAGSVPERIRELSILHSESDQTQDVEALTKGPRRLSIRLLAEAFRIRNRETTAPACLHGRRDCALCIQPVPGCRRTTKTHLRGRIADLEHPDRPLDHQCPTCLLRYPSQFL